MQTGTERLPYGDVDVLVVGGGVAGLAAGLVLGELAIPALVVERRPDQSSHPRATALTTTTMNLFRSQGVESAVRQAGFVSVPALSIRSSLVGPEVQRIPFEDHVWTCAQDRLEPILCERTRSAGTPVVYGWEATRVQVGEDRVQITLMDRSNGASSAVRARFLVAADGASSLVRAASGVSLSRFRRYGDWMSMLFQAPLRDQTGDPPCIVYGIANTDPLGVLVPTDVSDRWIRGIPWHPEAGERLEQYDTAHCTSIIRSAVGIATLPVTVLAVQTFRMAAGLVDRYRSGRVLLAGDAAHIFPPTTGMGLNVALHDGVSVAHCLAQVLKNGDSRETLDAYEAARRPIAETLLASDLAT